MAGRHGQAPLQGAHVEPIENIWAVLLPDLLPNSVARNKTQRDKERLRTLKAEAIGDVSGPNDTRREGRHRISRPVP
jgi:hypothetical protein